MISFLFHDLWGCSKLLCGSLDVGTAAFFVIVLASAGDVRQSSWTFVLAAPSFVLSVISSIIVFSSVCQP